MTAPVAEKEKPSASAGVDDPVLAGALDEMADIAAEPNDGGMERTVDETPVAETVEPTTEPTLDEVVAAVEATPAAAEPVVDPLADTAPLDYGTGKAFDGVLVDKTNGGAFILPDKLDAVRARLVEGDTYREQAQQLHERVQRYESLGGIEGYATLKAESEANSAAGMILMKAIAEAFPGPEHAQALKDLFSRAEFEMRKTAFDTGQKFRAEQGQYVSQATQGQAEAQTFDRAITQIKAALPSLTGQDMEAGRQFFAKRPTMLYRNASVQDAQQYGVKVGERLFDPTAMNEWYSERAALRAENAKQERERVTATAAAGKFNAAQDKGRQAGKKPATRAQSSATPAATLPEKASRRHAWADPLTTALDEMGIPG